MVQCCSPGQLSACAIRIFAGSAKQGSDANSAPAKHNLANMISSLIWARIMRKRANEGPRAWDRCGGVDLSMATRFG
jgi:hypothetical protein